MEMRCEQELKLYQATQAKAKQRSNELRQAVENTSKSQGQGIEGQVITTGSGLRDDGSVEFRLLQAEETDRGPVTITGYKFSRLGAEDTDPVRSEELRSSQLSEE